MFLNFPLHDSIQASSGVDLAPFKEALRLSGDKKTSWFRWSVQFCNLEEEFCRDNHLDAENPLRWDVIVLNLPGSKTYDPSKPRVYKRDRTMGCIAGDFVIFVDDCRVTAMTVELAWAIARQVCSRFQYLAIQDATRKQRPPTQNPGAWEGAVFATTDTTVTKTVTQEKWNKAKMIVSGLNNPIVQGGASTCFGYKELEISRGFLCHLSMTYEVLIPFLKGFHLALASHLGKRASDGWKLTDKAWASYLCEINNREEDVITGVDSKGIADVDTSEGRPEVPLFVKLSDNLHRDLTALAIFLESDSPPIIKDRSSNVRIVQYGFGDASGTGFGSTIQTKQGLKYRFGLWGSDDDNESSNFEELENVVITIKKEAAEGSFKNSALYFFTDNKTVEAALYTGNSTSRKLFDLVVRFRRIQLVYGMQVVVSYVSGKRMILQGTDGISRGNMEEGVGSGLDMLQFIPLHLGAIERNSLLLYWIKYWAGNKIECLSPTDWFSRGHDHFGGQRDASGSWRIKSKADGVDNKAWPIQMFEPLTLAFAFPFLSVKPSKRRGWPKMCSMARELSALWNEGEVDSRDFLRKCFPDAEAAWFHVRVHVTPGLYDTRDGDRLQEVWGKRQVLASAFLEARDEDHLMVPFECDVCIFVKLRGQEPNPIDHEKDKLLLSCIRRVNLDAFWRRMPSTVTTNRDKVRAGLKLSESVGLKGPYTYSVSFPEWDHCGYEVAIQMVLASLKPGRYSAEYTQWDTIRKLRTAFSNQYRASGQATGAEVALLDDRGHAQRLSCDRCTSVWFSRFFIGCKRRMGQDWRPNKAMDIHLILKLLRRIEARIEVSVNDRESDKWLTFGAYLSTSYVLSLRGVEGLLVDLKGMIKYREQGGNKYFIVALLGKIKGENQGRYHLLPSVKITSSGISVHVWVQRLIDRKMCRGFSDGPLFSDWSGKVATTDALDRLFSEILEEIYDDIPTLLPASITSRDEIAECNQVYRSIRRSSDSRSLEQKVSESDIDIVNRWK